MKSYEKRLEFWQCLRCDYLWPKRPGPRPFTCPGCHNQLWATEKRRAPGAGRKKKSEQNAGVASRPIPQGAEIPKQTEQVIPVVNYNLPTEK